MKVRSLLNPLYENPLFRRIVKNSGYLFSATGISAAISLLQSILVGRLLGIEGFGLLGVVIMFTSMINKFVSFRMSELIVKYIGGYTETDQRQHAAVVFKAAALAEMAASVITMLLIWLLSPLAAEYFAKDASLAYLFSLYGLIVLANLIAESSTGVLQVYDRYSRIAGINLVQSIFTLAVIGIVYFMGGGITAIVIAYLAGKTVGALSLSMAALLEASRQWGRDWWRAPFSLVRPQAREMAHFAFSTNISASLNIVNKDSELLWVSLFQSPLQAGYYKTALAILNLVQMPISPLPQATYPEISREAHRGNWKNVRYLLKQGSWLAGGFTLAVTIVLVLIGQQLILLLYRDPGFLPAYPALLILLGGFLVANTYYWNRIALLALGLPGFPTKINLILAVIKIIGIILLVPRYGYLASAALFAAYHLVSSSICARQTYRTLSKNELAATQAAQMLSPKPD